MVSNRRRAPADSEMRARLVAAAADIIREQGHGALTSRTLAERLSLKRQILHYYFESMDELLVLVVRSSAERALAALKQMTAAEDPLRAIWDMSSDPQGATLSLELAALAARNPAVREEVRESAERLRAEQTRILVDHLAARGLEPLLDPEFATFVMSALSQLLVQEDLVGITATHAKVRETVDRVLAAYAKTGKAQFFP